MRYSACVIAVVGLLLCASTGSADDLRIRGPRGLMRAVKPVEDSSTVRVQLHHSSSEEVPRLRNVDGIAADIEPIREGEWFVFFNVRPGTWEVLLTEKKEILHVKID